MQQIPYKAPEFHETSFNCPFCNAFAKQGWFQLKYAPGGSHYYDLKDTFTSICEHCRKYSIWYEGAMIYPNFFGIESPNQDLSEDIQRDYQEATEILQRSPRGAAALLRLAVQKLCIQLGENGNINEAIGNLVKNGLPVKIQQALDTLRVIGNEAVHPGQLDLRDDVETASALFRLLNFIAEKMISEPREVEALYDGIPDSKKEQIIKRDGS